jgi:phosphoketolase
MLPPSLTQPQRLVSHLSWSVLPDGSAVLLGSWFSIQFTSTTATEALSEGILINAGPMFPARCGRESLWQRLRHPWYREALVGNTYLEGTYSEIYPDISQDEAGLKRLFMQFSFPGGISSHVAPTTPGSIHEGGELGYSLSHAFGAAFDNPSLIVACIIGDGEAETGPLATSWQSNKLLNPISDGAVLPILHLNGFKISNPTVLARIEHEELEHFFRGCGWTPYFVEGDDPEKMHQLMAVTLEKAIEDIREIQENARNNNDARRVTPSLP